MCKIFQLFLNSGVDAWIHLALLTFTYAEDTITYSKTICPNKLVVKMTTRPFHKRLAGVCVCVCVCLCACVRACVSMCHVLMFLAYFLVYFPGRFINSATAFYKDICLTLRFSDYGWSRGLTNVFWSDSRW